jgi:hypothetical protein
MTFIIAHAQAPFLFGNTEAFYVGLSTVIIFAFLGPKLWADFKTS